jgi:hypothetical protein
VLMFFLQYPYERLPSLGNRSFLTIIFKHMKFNTFYTTCCLIAVWCLLTNSKIDPNNPPTARTGAPGETTCQASSCHSGGTFTGTVALSGIPDTVEYGKSYTITLTNTSNAARAGFQLTCLDGSNAKCGTLTAGTGTSVATATVSGRQYVRQSTPKNLVNGSTQWNFTWKAPASAASNAATLYFVSLCSNNNGKESGDNVLQATKAIMFKNAVAAHEPDLDDEVKLYPTTTHDVLNIEFQQATKGQLLVLDTQGKKVLEIMLSSTNRLAINDLKPGIYFAHISAEGKQTVKKFLVR